MQLPSPPSGGFRTPRCAPEPRGASFFSTKSSTVGPCQEGGGAVLHPRGALCVDLCSGAPACPLLTDWSKDAAVTGPTVSACGEVARCKTGAGGRRGVGGSSFGDEPGSTEQRAPANVCFGKKKKRLEFRPRLNPTEEPEKCLCVRVQMCHNVPSGWR